MQNIKKTIFFVAFLIAGVYLPICADNATENTPITEDTTLVQDSAPVVLNDLSGEEKPAPVEVKSKMTVQELVIVAASRIKEAIIEKSVISEELSFDLIDAYEYLKKIADQDKIIEANKRQLYALCGNFDKKQQYARALAVQLEKIRNQLSHKNFGSEVFNALDKEIYEQKVIAGDMMSPQKKLLIGAAVMTSLAAVATYSGLLTTIAASAAPVIAQEIAAQRETHSNESFPESSQIVVQQADEVNLPVVSTDNPLQGDNNIDDVIHNQESNTNKTRDKIMAVGLCVSLVLFQAWPIFYRW